MILSAGKREVRIDLPWLNAAGTLGFSGEAAPLVDASRLGAFVTHPVSEHARQPAGGPRLVRYPGGFLLHTGHPNPGLRTVLRRHRGRWRRMEVPVILHLLADGAQSARRILLELEALDEVAAIEVGGEFTDAGLLDELVRGLLPSELPILIQVPLDMGAEAVQRAANAAAVVLTPPRGRTIFDGHLVEGRIFGPALFPIMLQAVERYAPELSCPLITSGGVYDRLQRDTLLAAGAAAVQLDTVLWTHPEDVLS